MHRLWVHFFFHTAHPDSHKSINFSQVINWAIDWLLSVANRVRIASRMYLHFDLWNRAINISCAFRIFRLNVLIDNLICKSWFFVFFFHRLCGINLKINSLETVVINNCLWFNLRIFNFFKIWLITNENFVVKIIILVWSRVYFFS